MTSRHGRHSQGRVLGLIALLAGISAAGLSHPGPAQAVATPAASPLAVGAPAAAPLPSSFVAADPAPGPAAGPDSANATFGIQPATGGQPDARASLSYGATPGARLRDAVAVKNIGTTDITVRLYAADAANDKAGKIVFREDGDRGPDVGSWLALDGGVQQVTVPAGRNAAVPFTVNIPADASPGDHLGAVFAQLNAEGVGTDGAKVILKQRVGIRVALRVSGPVRPGLAISGLSSRYEQSANPLGSGLVRASFTVTNTGNVALRGDPRVLVTGLWNHQVVPIEQVASLLPGNSVVLHAEAAGVRPGGRLTVKAVVGVTAAPNTELPPQPDVTATTHVWALPWALIALVLLLLLVVALLLVWRRRQGGPPPQRRVTTPRRAPAPAGSA